MSRKKNPSRRSQSRQSPASARAPEPASKGGRGPVAAAILVSVAAVIVVVFYFMSTAMGPDKPAAPPGGSPLASSHSPTLGPADARVHIVEFMDPACETCASFYPMVKQLMAQSPGRVRLSIRHVPFHEGSEYAVRLVEASRNQGKYWETLEALLASQARWAPNHVVQAPLVRDAVAGVGLDMDKLQADMESPAVIARVEKDLADAAALKIRATPEFFVNGRPMPSFGWQQLATLVEEELAKAY